MHLTPVDYLILTLYFAFVIGIGWRLRKSVTSAGEFLTAGHNVPVWITSLAFLAANLGAQEVVGMAASGAKYGIMTSHFYWIGAVPAMLFVGVFMMPFYYGSKARSVPEYLKMRFDEKTRGLNAITFAIMTLFSSGISMYALGKMFQLVLGWSFDASVLLSAVIVLAYTYLGGLTSAIYNEVLQFFLIVIGFSPLAILSVQRAGGWGGIQQRLPDVMTHAWRYIGDSSQNPMGVEAFGLVGGLGFVLSFGYWCTDFLVIQRAMAANSMSGARRTPVLAAFPKMIMPFIVILPGIAALALTKMGSGYSLPPKGTSYDYDQALTTLMAQFYPSGLLGVGLTALMASFMSGMAGNVTAFNTVFTYDIYQGYLRPNEADRHYLTVGRITTVVGIALSIATAYLAAQFNDIMDFLQLVFGFVNAPLFATFLLGMFWKRATGHGAFWGLLSGTGAAALTFCLSVAEGKGGSLAVLHIFPSQMAQNFWIAIFAFSACLLVTAAISLATAPKSNAQLEGLVYGLTKLAHDEGALVHAPRSAGTRRARLSLFSERDLPLRGPMLDLRIPSGLLLHRRDDPRLSWRDRQPPRPYDGRQCRPPNRPRHASLRRCAPLPRAQGSRRMNFRAPGRVNLIGEHTDYNQGFVLPIALNLATYVETAPSPDEQFHLESETHEGVLAFTAEQLPHLKARGAWFDYIVGVARQLPPVAPMKVHVRSDVPEGAGLSSSAALEVSSALAFLQGKEFDRLQLALLCQRAEIEYVGMPCGIMDQYVSVFGQAHAAIKIDCRSLEHETVEIPDDVAIVAVNSMVKHELGDSAYRTRVKECAEACAAIGVTSLRDATLEQAQPFKRARHVVSENQRVLDFVVAARRHDLVSMGRLFVESHRSMQHDYEISCPEIDFLVDTAITIPGCYGARMTGGGFGGSTVNLVDPDHVEVFTAYMTTAYKQRFGIDSVIFRCVPGPGASQL